MNNLKRQREYRKKNHNACTLKYEKTINGHLMRMYRNMKSRVEGIQWHKAHLYKGKSLLLKEDFYSWAKSCPEFILLHKKWLESNCDRRLVPTVNRINPLRGYELDNMEWLTHSENSSLGAKNKRSVLNATTSNILRGRP